MTFGLHPGATPGDPAFCAFGAGAGGAGPTVPATPVAPTAVAGDTVATVILTAPFNGGIGITGYTVTSSPAGGVDSNAGSTMLSHIITGLTNGVLYTFTFRAVNNIGQSASSPPSSGVTPLGSVSPGGDPPITRALGVGEIVSAASIPTAGTWQIGDICVNTAGGAPTGWLCTKGGSPGIWTAFGSG